MPQHEVEVTDRNGATATLEVTVPHVGEPMWRVKSHRFLRLQSGVADRGDDASGQWLALYGAKDYDDRLLVLHLDAFFGGAGVNGAGAGTLYEHDNLLMVPGPLSWRLVASTA
jgi:hypothetical protein